MFSLSLLFCAPLLFVQEPLNEVRAVAWRSQDGQCAVLHEKGRSLQILDAYLRPVTSFSLGNGEVGYQDVRSYAGQWLIFTEDARVYRLGADQALHDWQLPWGMPSARVAEECLRTAGVGGRPLRFDPETQVLSFGLTGWEHPGEVEWGPGWAAVRFRCSRSLGPYVLWRTQGEELRKAWMEADRFDPLVQRAYLRPITNGQVLELRHRPLQVRYPSAEWSKWKKVKVPSVTLEGTRPVTVLPSFEG